MKPKVCIVCYGRLSEMMHNLYNKIELPVELNVYTVLLDNSTELPEKFNEIDVFLSSGYNGQILKSKVAQPVILMETGVMDMLLALKEALEYDEEPLVIPFQKDYAFLEQISDLLSVNIKQESFTTPENLMEILQRHKAAGGKTIVGTALACQYAEDIGMKGFFTRPQEALLNYLNIAADMAIKLKQESAKYMQFNTIINYFDRGLILAADNVITLCNPLAANCFRYLNKPLVGMPIEQFIKELSFESQPVDINDLDSPLLNSICRINGTRYITDFIPILFKNSMYGVMINLNDWEAFQNTSRKLQGELIEKGFVAKHSFQTISAQSPNFKKVINVARRYSQMDEAIVILGETGVGKEVMAHSIHSNSKRAQNPFVAVNCSAMNEKLLESELFGYDEGSFTGARKGGKEGIFEMANKGTIFLDEIGEINATIQVKLLRAIQEKEIMRVGGNKIIHFDARIIAATNKDLWELVEEGKFREDLYYRINVLELTIPPLRERRGDIYPLFSTFLSASLPNITPLLHTYEFELAKILNVYDWPGNIRELNNFTKMLVATIENQSSVEQLMNSMEDIIKGKVQRRKKQHKSEMMLDEGETREQLFNPKALSENKKKREISEINEALSAAAGNQQKAAELLGINRTTLWRRMKKYQDD